MSTRYDNLISSEEEKTESKSPNRFAQSISSLKRKENDTSNNSKENETNIQEDKPVRPRNSQDNKTKEKQKTTEETRSENAILNELFPEESKAEDFKSHSLYLKNSHWKKIQSIARDQNISNSAVLTKILDKVL